MRWAALSVCLALAGIGMPAEAHIFGTKSDHYIRITPLYEAPVLEVETFARYEWCQWSIDPETYELVTGACEPIGSPGWVSIDAFSRLFHCVEGGVVWEQKMMPAMEQIVDVAFIFMGGWKAADFSTRMALKYLLPRLPEIWLRSPRTWVIALFGGTMVGGYAGGVATDVGIQYSKKLIGWTVEALEKNNVRTIARSDDPLKSSAAWFEALIFNPFVLSGQGENNDMVEESFFFDLEGVRRVIEMYVEGEDSR